MRVHFSDDVDVYASAVIPFLDADPCGRNVPRTVIDGIRDGTASFTTPPSFWWVEDDHGVAGAAHWTPPFPLLVTSMPGAAAAALARGVVTRAQREGAMPAGVNGPRDAAHIVAAGIAAESGARVEQHAAMLLLETAAVTPVPRPEGERIAATAQHAEVCARWLGEFATEARTAMAPDPGAWVHRMTDAGLLDLWAVRGEPVSMAAHRKPAMGVTRVGPVYTPPQHRNHGYARRLVAEITAAALAQPDVSRCMLFADAANPVSNSIYRQAGYVTTAEHVELRLLAP